MKNLTEGSIYKNFILFAVPMVLAALFSRAYQTIDAVIAGRFLGEEGLAATGATSAFITLVSCMFYGFGTGFAVYIAKLFGAKDYRRLKSDIISGSLLVFAVSLLIGIIMALSTDGILTMLNVDSSVKHASGVYFCVYSSGFCFVILSNFFVYIMNSMGSSSFPFVMSVLSAVLNVVGNLISVTVTPLGVAGIALSSVLAAAAVDICYIFKLRACFKAMEGTAETSHLSFAGLRNSFRYSLPGIFQQGVMYLASVAMSPIINGIGSEATAGYAVVMNIYNTNSAVYQNSSKTLSNFAAQSVGANKHHLLPKGLKVGLLQGMLFVLPFLLACTIWAEPVCRMFLDSSHSVKALDYAITFSRYFLPFILLNLLNNLFHAYFRGIAVMHMLFISTVIGAVTRTAASLLLVPAMGMNGVYLGWVISWAVEMIFTVIMYMIKYRTTEQIRLVTDSV